VGITDGDTLSVLRDGKAAKVRLWGIDTPEKQQAFGTRARQFTSELALQQTVTVRDTDRYGRLVGEVILSDGRSLNCELVAAGMAWWYRQYAKDDATLAKSSKQRRKRRNGDCGAIRMQSRRGRGEGRGSTNHSAPAGTGRELGPEILLPSVRWCTREQPDPGSATGRPEDLRQTQQSDMQKTTITNA
jgi:hypothetical protein